VREGRYDVSQLEASSAIILIGHVTAVKKGADLSDTATIKVVSVLKGKLADQELTLDYRARAREERDLRTFRIKRGSSGIFFLSSVDAGKATLVMPGGMAFFPIPTYVGAQQGLEKKPKR
jgi:hypothetical protein